MPNSRISTTNDNQNKSFVESPSRGSDWAAREVFIGNGSGDAVPVNVVSGGSGGNANELNLVANENISALKIVRQDTGGVLLADIGAQLDSEALGVSRDAATLGSNLRVITYGRVDDTSFGFTLNEPLFLGNNGLITNLAPTNSGEYIVRIGYSLGIGSIFIDIESPVLII